MRILLIESAKPDVSLAGEDVFIYEPLGLEYVAAGVLDEHEVRILDMRLDKNLESVLADFHRQLAFMKKYPLKELPGLIAKGRRFYGRRGEAYKDYENQFTSPHRLAIKRADPAACLHMLLLQAFLFSCVPNAVRVLLILSWRIFPWYDRELVGRSRK